MNIYIHIPFCRSKCAYCAFLSMTDMSFKNEYIAKLLDEIESRKSEFSSHKVETIYFGGGTPSLIESEKLIQIISRIKNISKLSNEIEITLEANPEDITESRLKEWQNIGVNRISIGIQSLNEGVRETIGRRLNVNEVVERVQLTKKYFDNIGVDLIAGLPGDNVVEFIKNIELLKLLNIHHFSIYDLEFSEGSQICLHPEKFSLLNEKDREDFLLRVWDRIKVLDFEQYEISNFSDNFVYSRHNYDFWKGEDYLGFGLGASSLNNNILRTNTSDFKKYLAQEYVSEIEEITEINKIKLDLMLNLRLNISAKENLKKYQKISKTNNTIILKDLIKDGFVTKDYLLTQKGKLFYNSVIDKIIV